MKTLELLQESWIQIYVSILWQQPKDDVTWGDATWFKPQPLSKNKIGSLMTSLSKEANLSKNCTNHCVRSTCITVLDNKGHEARYINTKSLNKNDISSEKKMAEALLMQ